MAAKGKGYKAQAKAEAERAEKAIVAGRALQMQHRAAVQRISELEEALRRANGGVGIDLGARRHRVDRRLRHRHARPPGPCPAS